MFLKQTRSNPLNKLDILCSDMKMKIWKNRKSRKNLSNNLYGGLYERHPHAIYIYIYMYIYIYIYNDK